MSRDKTVTWSAAPSTASAPSPRRWRANLVALIAQKTGRSVEVHGLETASLQPGPSDAPAGSRGHRGEHVQEGHQKGGAVPPPKPNTCSCAIEQADSKG